MCQFDMQIWIWEVTTGTTVVVPLVPNPPNYANDVLTQTLNPSNMKPSTFPWTGPCPVHLERHFVLQLLLPDPPNGFHFALDNVRTPEVPNPPNELIRFKCPTGGMLIFYYCMPHFC